MRCRVGSAICAAALAAGCTPTLNWRDVSIAAIGLQSLFPCKPQHARRSASGGGSSELWSCRAGEWTFAVAHGDLGTASDAGKAIAAMRESLALQAGGSESSTQHVTLPGSNGPAMRLAIHGRSAAGVPVEVQAQLFARRGTVVQASVMGKAALPPEAAASFFAGLRWADLQ